MNNLIVLTGLKGSGKSTVADYLVENHGYISLSFADGIKDCLSVLFHWDRSLLEGDTVESREWRETVDPWWSERLNIPNFTPRYAMTYFGTDIMRVNVHTNMWLFNIQRRMDEIGGCRIVIPDGRFHNEIDFGKSRGGQIVRTMRGGMPDWEPLSSKALNGCVDALSALQELGVHESEWTFPTLPFDATLDNSGTIDELHNIINKTL